MSETPPESTDQPVGAPTFEFSAEHNRTLRQLSLRMGIVGVAMLIWGLLQAPRVLANGDVGALIFSLVLLVSGVWTIRAAKAFRDIHQTEGSDIEHLMRALTSVHHLYTLVSSVIAVVVVWIVIALAFALIVALG